MRNNFIKIIKKYIRSLGFDIHHLSPDSNTSFQLLKGLERFNVDIVFDIGANTGQFASELRSVGFGKRIVSFEPLPEAYTELINKSHYDLLWDVHSRVAIGDFDGEIEINIAGNSVSSSVLPMLDSHSVAAEGSAYVGKLKVPIVRLDSIISKYIKPSERYFIKIDTQGFEWQVLDGASEALANAQGVLCELSLVYLYEGQKLWMEMIDRLEAEGFTLWMIQKGFIDPHDGRTLQIDAIFFKLQKS
jgi:FkbM family methyltransferase